MKIQIKLYDDDGRKLHQVEYSLDPVMSVDQAENLLAEIAVKVNLAKVGL